MKKRILVYYPSELLNRGTPLRAYWTAKSLQKAGNEVVFAVASKGDFADTDLKIVEIGRGRVVSNVRSLAALAKSFKPDIIYGHTHNGMTAALAAAKMSRAKAFIDLHGHPLGEIEMSSVVPLVERMRGPLLERVALRFFDGITVVSNPLRDYLVSRGIDGEKIYVLHGGFDPGSFKGLRPAAKKGLDVLYLGNLKKWQGIDLIIGAAELLKGRSDISFTIIGGGEDGQQYKKLASRKMLKNVAFLGPVKKENVPQTLVKFGALIIPRRENKASLYGFPSKLPEYMMSGVPVIATGVGETGRIIKDGVNGLLIEPNAASLADAIRRLAGNPAMRSRLGSNAQRLALSGYSWENLAKGLDCFLERRAMPANANSL